MLLPGKLSDATSFLSMRSHAHFPADAIFIVGAIITGKNIVGVQFAHLSLIIFSQIILK